MTRGAHARPPRDRRTPPASQVGAQASHLPQQHRTWFETRGVDIDQYTLRLTEGDHSALHFGGGPGKGGGWWNEQMMERLFQAESRAGRQLTFREILYEGAQLRRRAGLQHVKVERY
ncbi:MAG: DUF2380 domain-containing protein [Polyangiaceae bacterium]|nr:DUF2380 domain-containing protein [Polyangiaceae bacterium]